VVRHQAIGPDRYASPSDLLGKQVHVDVLIARLEEYWFAVIAPLGDVMRDAGNDDAGETCHGQKLARLERIGNNSRSPLRG